ncbi:hypothetical protein ACT3UA_11455 [Glutamicibacter sp. 363]|uniref:hypothetical protein n=1 Tax=unclassified Glutamicibacter TaxID=2627139 RepID=UPI00403355EF
MAQPSTQPTRTPKELVAKAIKECSEQSSEFRIYPRELSRETYALLIFACSVHCPIERVAEERFRVTSMTEKGKTFSIKEGDDFRRVFKLMIKAFLPGPDQRMPYLRRSEQYAEACLSTVDEMQENSGSLPLLSDILPTLNTEAGSDQESTDETAGDEKKDPRDQLDPPSSAEIQASLPTPTAKENEPSAFDEMSAEQKIDAIQRVLGITKKTREEQAQREKTIIRLTERVSALEARTEELKRENEEAEEAKTKLRREYDDYKLKVRSVLLD